jgi:serine/threonine-protein kinase
MPRAERAAKRALQIDDRLAEAHTSLATILANFTWDRVGAAHEFRRALELDPGYATLHQWHSLFLLAPEGRFHEAKDQIQQAERLDPVSLPIALDRALVEIFAGRYADAVSQCAKVFDLDTSYHRANWFVGLACERLGDSEGAVDALEKALAHDLVLNRGSAFRSRIRGALGRCYARAGKTDQAEAILGEMEGMSKATYVDQFETAQIRVGLGDVDGAINCLERAARERTSFLVFSNVWPGFEILRIASRYDAILSQLSLKPVLSADARLGSPQPDLRQA